METVFIEDGVQEIEDDAFTECTSLKNLRLPGTLEDFLCDSFSECSSLETIVIPEGVKNVNSAFIGCDNLSYVSFPKSVEFIYAYILGDCNNIKEVTYNGTKEDWTKVEFSAGFTDPHETHVYYFEGLKSWDFDEYIEVIFLEESPEPAKDSEDL